MTIRELYGNAMVEIHIPAFVPPEAAGRDAWFGSISAFQRGIGYRVSGVFGRDPFLLDGAARAREYQGVFRALILGVYSDDHQAVNRRVRELERASAILKTGASASDVLQQLGWTALEGVSLERMGRVVAFLGSVIQVASALEAAEQEAFLTRLSLGIRAGERMDWLSRTYRGYSGDPALLLGLSQAVQEIDREFEEEYREFLERVRSTAGRSAVGQELVEWVTTGVIGVGVKSLLGSGVAATGIATAAPAVLLWGLWREGNRIETQRRIILLQTLLRSLPSGRPGGFESAAIAILADLTEKWAGTRERPIGMLDPNFVSMDGTRGDWYLGRARRWLETLEAAAESQYSGLLFAWDSEGGAPIALIGRDGSFVDPWGTGYCRDEEPPISRLPVGDLGEVYTGYAGGIRVGENLHLEVRKSSLSEVEQSLRRTKQHIWFVPSPKPPSASEGGPRLIIPLRLPGQVAVRDVGQSEPIVESIRNDLMDRVAVRAGESVRVVSQRALSLDARNGPMVLVEIYAMPEADPDRDFDAWTGYMGVVVAEVGRAAVGGGLRVLFDYISVPTRGDGSPERLRFFDVADVNGNGYPDLIFRSYQYLSRGFRIVELGDDSSDIIYIGGYTDPCT